MIQLSGLLAQSSSPVAESTDYYKVFYEAVASGNLLKARQAKESAKIVNKPISDEAVLSLVFASKFFDRVNPLLEDIAKTNVTSIIEDDNVFSHMRPEHIAWLDKADYLSARFAPRYLVLAAQKGDGEMVKALLNTQVAHEFTIDQIQHPLYSATAARSLQIVDILLSHGANAYLDTVQVKFDRTEKISAVDIAAKNFWIAGLKRLDSKGKYQKLITDFEKEFPSTKNSPFVGAWNNQKDGFYEAGLQLSSDATGVLVGFNFHSPIAWSSNTNGAEIFLISDKGIDRDRTIHMTWDANRAELVWNREKGEPERFRKTGKHAPGK